MIRKLVAFALIALGVFCGVVYARGDAPFALVAALFLFGAGALLLPATHEVAAQLRPWLGEEVDVKAWGSSFPDTGGRPLRFKRTVAIGAGLHLFFTSSDSDSQLHLKIAQPVAVTSTADRFEVEKAKYVQWRGKKIKKLESEKALVLQRSGRQSSIS